MIKFANHAHVFPESVRADGTIKRLTELMERCQIERAVAFAPFSDQVSHLGTNPNAWLAKEIEATESIVGFGTIDPDGKDLGKQAEEMAQLGFRGVKLHPAYQRFSIMEERLSDFYVAAEELDLFLCFHSGIHWHRIKDYHPLLFDELAYRYPRLRFSMEHVGGLSFFDDALAVMLNNTPPGKSGNVFGGITSVLNRTHNKQWFLGAQRVEMLLDLLGPDQFIFGLDFPYNKEAETEEAIAAVQSLQTSQESKDLILGGNLERVLQLQG